MSADNRLCLMEQKMPWGQTDWYVWHGSCSDSYHEPPIHAIWFRDEKDARDFLRTEADRIDYLEGGVTIIGPEEQEEALRAIINDAQKRLDNLLKTGHQLIES